MLINVILFNVPTQSQISILLDQCGGCNLICWLNQLGLI